MHDEAFIGIPIADGVQSLLIRCPSASMRAMPHAHVGHESPCYYHIGTIGDSTRAA